MLIILVTLNAFNFIFTCGILSNNNVNVCVYVNEYIKLDKKIFIWLEAAPTLSINMCICIQLFIFLQ